MKVDTKAIQAIHDHVITHNPRVSVSHSDYSTWNLHVKNVQEEDRGMYMCQINTDPMKSQVREMQRTGMKVKVSRWPLATCVATNSHGDTSKSYLTSHPGKNRKFSFIIILACPLKSGIV